MTDNDHLDAIRARIEQIGSDQANRLNDGWAHPKAGKMHQAYLDIDYLLAEIARLTAENAALKTRMKVMKPYWSDDADIR